ncbi:hypothetical protein C8R43DRAFT_896500 [Mycena crocata]|nr:hypothetical protein C8R43DRAFT_896500 [Mycena crocata]
MASLESRIRPIGLIWDSTDYSCGYDATFTILANIWLQNPAVWSVYFSRLGQILADFAVLMGSVRDRRITFEKCRDLIRRTLHAKDAGSFPYGRNMSSVDRIAMAVLPSAHYAVGRQFCDECGHMDRRSYGMLEAYMSAGLSPRREYPDSVTLQSWLDQYLARGREACSACHVNGLNTRLTMRATIRDIPPIIWFDINHPRLCFNRDIRLESTAGLRVLRIRGIIYGGQSHFTAKVIDPDGQIWFHDGIGTRGVCIPQGNIQEVDPMSLHKCGEKNAVAVIYARLP